jgi:hypothetical protein
VSPLLPAQAGYTAAGLAYNAISLFEARHGRPPLTRGPAAINAGIFVLYAAALVLGAFGFTTGYRVAIAVFVVLLGYGGVVVHLRRGPTDFYRGKTAWVCAIAINGIGFALNLTGLVTGP